MKEFPIKPVSVRGRCFRRVAGSNRVMTLQEIAQIHLNTVRQSWDQLLSVNASIDDIEVKKVEWYLARREAVRNVTPQHDMEMKELLINIAGISREEHVPTHAGILFFGKSPQQFFPNAGLRLVKFKGTDVTHPVINRQDCKGTLWEMVSFAEEFIRKNIRLFSFRRSTRFQRTDQFEYPLDALREAIINGLIHRNYQELSDVRVFLFPET